MQLLKWTFLVLAVCLAWRADSQVAQAQGCTAARGCPSLPPSLPGNRNFSFNLNSQQRSAARASTPAPSAAIASQMAPTPRSNSLAASGTQVVASAPQGSATIRVQVPTADAKLWFQGAATKRQGTSRVFKSPQLDGGSHRYLVRCVWTEDGREVSREKYVAVSANQEAVVDFGSAKQVAQR